MSIRKTKRSKEGRFLEIIIKGTEKEIADLVLRLQGQLIEKGDLIITPVRVPEQN